MSSTTQPISTAPPENAVVVRGDAHPFLITSIRHGNDDQVTVYTQEVVKL